MIILQKPNKSFIITFLSLIISIISTGTISNISFTIGFISGIFWSYLELTSGINIIRRLFGVLGFMLLGFLYIKKFIL